MREVIIITKDWHVASQQEHPHRWRSGLSVKIQSTLVLIGTDIE